MCRKNYKLWKGSRKHPNNNLKDEYQKKKIGQNLRPEISLAKKNIRSSSVSVMRTSKKSLRTNLRESKRLYKVYAAGHKRKVRTGILAVESLFDVVGIQLSVITTMYTKQKPQPRNAGEAY